MFGEDDTDSPRLSSPWEAFSSSPSPCPGLASSLSSSVSSSDIEAELARRLQTEVPRLVPEIEEGNVEYKLKLSPSPERLTRLVTQLKWRLLEGGGQALYEIGVGDNGQLIGLTRGEMEGSLDALEKMAGELGATVMILREIVVPRAVVDRAKGDPDPGMLLMPDISRSSSASRSGSGSGDDELEAFSLDLEDDVKPATWTPQAPLTDPKAKLNRRNKSATKAEHKKVRRAVKKRVNAAFATKPPKMLRLEAFDTAVPVGLDVPDIAFPGVVIDNSVDTVPFEPTPRPVPCDDPDEVIIVEALVVRKLALEEAFLDFGGFSVLG